MTKSRPAISAWENDRTIVRFPDPAVEVVDERFRSLVVWQEVVERLWTGGRWLEGPVWFGDGRYLLFSDIPNNRMLCWSEVTGDVTAFVSRRTTATATPETGKGDSSRAST